MPATPPSRRQFWLLDRVLPLLLALLALGFVCRRTAAPGVAGIKFLYSDEGVSFLVTDALLHGRTLYRDIAYAYGYIPAYTHAAAAWMFGNTVATYLHYFEAMDMVILVLVYALLRKLLRPWTAFLFAAAVMLPQIITPGSMLGDYIGNAAYPYEKVLMLAVALLWQEPPRQPWWRALLLGACLGMLQGVKFGTGIVLGGGLAVVEVISWARTGFASATLRVRLRNNLAVLGGFLLVEGGWVAVTLANMPVQFARDALWPLYALKNYQEFSAERYPGWLNLGFFVGVQMVPVLGLIGSLWWLGRQCLPPSAAEPVADERADASGGILVLVAFYVLSCFVFFKHQYHFSLYAWILSLGGVYLLLQPRRLVRWGAVGVWGLVFAVFLGLGRSHPRPALVPLALDDGEQLWVKAAERQEINGIVAQLRAPAGSESGKGQAAPVAFYPLGAGLHVFFHLPQRGRHYWYVPGLIQPYDLANVRALARDARWVFHSAVPVETPVPDPKEWDRLCGAHGETLDQATVDDLSSQLTLDRKIDPYCWIFSHRP